MDLLNTGRTIALGTALMGVVAAGAGRTSEIAVEERANANASIAATGQFAAVVWGATTVAGLTDIYVAISGNGGRTFSAPMRVNHVSGEAALSGEQPPRVALISRPARPPSIVVMWTARAAVGTRLLSARSDDGGRSFGSADPVPGSQASGNRGWESLAPTRDGSVVSVWLDHRELAAGRSGAAAATHAEHRPAASDGQTSDGVARAQRSQLFFARLDKPSSTRSIAGGVCYCCKTAVATGNDGAVYVAWRHVYPGNVRDIAFTMSADAGETFAPPVRVSDDRWVLDGCPENGPALTVDRRNRIHVVWPTLVPGPTSASEPTLALFYTVSRDGHSFSARQQIPTEGVPRHPQIALGSQSEVVIVWDEQAGGLRRIALARGVVDGASTARFRRRSIEGAGAAGYPVVATVDDGTIVAWTSGSAGQTVLRTERLAD